MADVDNTQEYPVTVTEEGDIVIEAMPVIVE